MLYKESAIAVMVAVMLGAASLLGGLAVPALASDPIASKQISQADNESTIVSGIELTAKKFSTRSTGTLTIEILQDGDALRSATLSTRSLQTTLTTVEVDVPGVNVTGNFEILVEYEGSGVITVSSINLVGGTEVAGPVDSGGSGSETGGAGDGDGSVSLELDNVIANKTFTIGDEETLNLDSVTFDAKKFSSRSTGTLTVALVQDDEVLDSKDINSRAMETTYTSFDVSFDEEVSDDFQVVFMYEGSGVISLRDIDIDGATEVEEGGGSNPPPSGTLQLTVAAKDQNGAALTELLWVAVNTGVTWEGALAPETFDLAAGTYTVSTDNYFSDPDGDGMGVSYTFVKWSDDSTEKSRSVSLTGDNTLTATFNVVDNSPPPSSGSGDTGGTGGTGDTGGSGSSGGPSGGEGSIAAYAYRIPSQYWAPTFSEVPAAMHFALYNSTGQLVDPDGYFYNEDGTLVTGLNDGEEYWIYAQSCHHCHGGTHDVAFHNWEDDTTDPVRSITTGMTVKAYYEYIPDTP